MLAGMDAARLTRIRTRATAIVAATFAYEQDPLRELYTGTPDYCNAPVLARDWDAAYRIAAEGEDAEERFVAERRRKNE